MGGNGVQSLHFSAYGFVLAVFVESLHALILFFHLFSCAYTAWVGREGPIAALYMVFSSPLFCFPILSQRERPEITDCLDDG